MARRLTFSYDADGHRIAKPVSSTTWLVDTNNLTGYAQVLEERISQSSIPASQIARTYTYGTLLISKSLAAGYATDGHGNVRELTAPSGTITDHYDYDAFGNLTFSSGTTLNVFLYCGEQYDPDLGLYYLRARYLSTDSGRFWSVDSFAGNRQDPASLHKYLYASANPVTYLDPSGHFSMVEIQQALSAIGNTLRIAYPVIYQVGQRAAFQIVRLALAQDRILFYVELAGVVLGGLAFAGDAIDFVDEATARWTHNTQQVPDEARARGIALEAMAPRNLGGNVNTSRTALETVRPHCNPGSPRNLWRVYPRCAGPKLEDEMIPIPNVLLIESRDRECYLLLHQCYDPISHGGVSVGDFEEHSRAAFEQCCRDRILMSLDGYSSRSKGELTRYDQMTPRERRDFFARNRFVEATLRGDTVDFDALHVERGQLVGCDPSEVVTVERLAPNEEFWQALETAFARC